MDGLLIPPATARIKLRHFELRDAPDLLRMDTDPEVMRYLEPPDYTLEKEEMVVGKVREYYERYPGYGAFTAELIETGQYVGWFSLKHLHPPAKSDEIEIGYRMLPEFWGQGLATEVASSLVHYGFNNFPLEFICGVTHPDHIASQRVLQKAGMSFRKTFDFHGEIDNYYSILREEFEG